MVLDVNMPDMSGIEVAREIQKIYETNPSQMPLIYFLSGDSPEYYKDELDGIIYEDYFTKLGLKDEIFAIYSAVQNR